MDKFEKLALEAIEEGKKTTYIPHQNPFVSFGFAANPFTKVSMAELNKESFLDLRFKSLIRYFTEIHNSFQNALKKKKKSDDTVILDGAVYSASQSGVSTLVTLAHQYLVKLDKDLSDAVFIDSKDLVEFEENQYLIAKTIRNFRNYLGNLGSSGDSISLIIVDHSDLLIEFFEEFRYALDRDFQNTPIIFIFSHSGWTRLKNKLAFSDYDLYNRIPKNEKINPLSKEDIKEVLELKLSRDNQIQPPFSSEVISLIAKLSSGSLLNAIKICEKLCEECYYNGLDIASPSLVQDVCARLGININQEFYDLITLNDNTQTFILALIAMRSIAHDFGVTYDDIVVNLGIQKTSASHHLKQLQEKRYVSKQTINRKAHYKLRDELKTIADTHLLPRFEQKEAHIKLESLIDMM